jgi:dodecin
LTVARRARILHPAQPDAHRRYFVSDHVYKKIEITGSSTDSIEDAIRRAVAKAGESVHNLRWFEVGEIRGHIDDGQVAHFQVTVKVGFTVD